MTWLRCALAISVLLLAAGCVWLPGPMGPVGPAGSEPQAGQVFAPPEAAPLSAQEVDQRLAQAQVLLVGEVHDHPGHHRIQLDMLKRMAALGGPLVVGVEWLEAPAQAACDEFSAGRLSLEQFALKVDWEGRWGFPLEVYAPILEFVRQNHLPLVALNAPREEVRQVARQGLGSLTPEQRGRLAPALDLGDPAYRRLLASQFKMHGLGRGPSQEDFFTAQVARDETMAHRLAQAMHPWPDGGKRAVLLVGSGHLAHGLGLPTRLARRLPGVRLLTVMPVPGGMTGMAGMAAPGPPHAPPADLLVVSTPAPPPPPRLGLVLQPQAGGLLIERVLDQTPAQTAGLKPGDLLVAIDDQPLSRVKQIHDMIKNAPWASHVYRVQRGGEYLVFSITLEAPGR
ncbi:MAG: ChaN family lipoprotein [Pseudomonadota bacterium]